MQITRTFIVSTRNLHKVQEIGAILGSGFELRGLETWPDAPKIIEDAPSFEGNARKKSLGLARWLTAQPANGSVSGFGGDIDVLADDSGLEVDALNGAPGVHSARFSADEPGVGENCSDFENNRKLLRLLRDVPLDSRTGRFRCVIAVTPFVRGGQIVDEAAMELETRCFQGVCPGTILFEPRGTSGFGYDPLFVPTGHRETFAQLGEVIKNGLSHRAQAVTQLAQWLSNRV